MVPNKPYFPHVPSKIIFHHYGFPEDRPKAKMMKTFRGNSSILQLQKDDINHHGLIDIRHHYIIAPNGDTYEGRPDRFMGTHTPLYNNGSISILVWGNFNSEQVSYEIKVSMIKLLLHLKKKHNLNMTKSIFGHSCKELTSCPGFNLQNYIIKLRRGTG